MIAASLSEPPLARPDVSLAFSSSIFCQKYPQISADLLGFQEFLKEIGKCREILAVFSTGVLQVRQSIIYASNKGRADCIISRCPQQIGKLLSDETPSADSPPKDSVDLTKCSVG